MSESPTAHTPPSTWRVSLLVLLVVFAVIQGTILIERVTTSLTLPRYGLIALWTAVVFVVLQQTVSWPVRRPRAHWVQGRAFPVLMGVVVALVNWTGDRWLPGR